MPRNKGKGGKNRKRQKNENETQKLKSVVKEERQESTQVPNRIYLQAGDLKAYEELLDIAKIETIVANKANEKETRRQMMLMIYMFREHWLPYLQFYDSLSRGGPSLQSVF